MTYLHHITLDTGHVYRAPRAGMDARAMALATRLLSDALADGTGEEHVAIPYVTAGYTLTAAAAGRCLTILIWGPQPGGKILPLVTLGVATHSRCGARLWRVMHEDRDGLATDGQPTPPEPWLAARLEQGILAHPDALDWLADLEQGLAWAWVEMRGTTPATARGRSTGQL